MVAGESALMRLVQAIAADETSEALRTLESTPSLATARLEHGATRQVATDFYLDEIGHYVYAGDTALHVAAAGYRTEVAKALVTAGADLDASNRNLARPLHYAADGTPGSPNWNPAAQAATIAFLIDAGSDPNVTDGRGVAPLHRAVRTRCAAAVKACSMAAPTRTARTGTARRRLTWRPRTPAEATPAARKPRNSNKKSSESSNSAARLPTVSATLAADRSDVKRHRGAPRDRCASAWRLTGDEQRPGGCRRCHVGPKAKRCDLAECFVDIEPGDVRESSRWLWAERPTTIDVNHQRHIDDRSGLHVAARRRTDRPHGVPVDVGVGAV
jgi:hypothetical protein